MEINVRIDRDAYNDLIDRKTGNILSEDEIPGLLARMVEAGAKVLLTDGDTPVEALVFANGELKRQSLGG